MDSPAADSAAGARWVEPFGASAVLRWWRGDARGWGPVLDFALAPAELLYRGAARVYHGMYDRGLRHAEQVGLPVISVGNISLGGSGKTPVVRWIVSQLQQLGAAPAILHGGYAPDEPALHRSWHPGLPVIAQRDRIAAARRARAEGASVAVLDDGFQHRRLARDIDIVLVPAEGWTAQPRLLPRGPWRESPRSLRRADVVGVTRKAATAEEASRVADEMRRLAPHAQVARFLLRPSGWRAVGSKAPEGDAPYGDVLAVSGVARPQPFWANAKEAGARVCGALVFKDHHAYGPDDHERIRQAAGGRPIVTTSKDAIKLAPLAEELEIWVLEQDVVPEAGAEALLRLLNTVL